MHPVIRLCPIISVLSEAWGCITGGKPPGIGLAQVTSWSNADIRGYKGEKALRTNTVAAKCKVK